MEWKAYLDEIIVWVGTTIAALGGTSISIAAIAAWIKKQIVKAVSTLFEQKIDYAAGVEDLKGTAANFVDSTAKINELIQMFEKQADEVKAFVPLMEQNMERIARLEQAIALIAQNTPYMVANGTAGEIVKLLDIGKAEIVGDEAVTENEVDG